MKNFRGGVQFRNKGSFEFEELDKTRSFESLNNITDICLNSRIKWKAFECFKH